MLGVSTDSVTSHQKFAQKYGITFPLLADTKATVTRSYGVAKPASEGKVRARRVTFLIDKAGIIEKIWDPVKASEHNEQVLAYLRMRKT